jgi:rhomboid protease GluP
MNSQSVVTIYIKKHPINAFLILLNFLFFVVTLLTGGFDIENIVRLGAIFPPFILDENEYFRLITGMFLHANVFHFLMNMYVLYYLGGHMEQLIGPRKFLLLYFFSGIVSSLVITYFGDPQTVTVGASGAIFGIMGGLFMLTILRKNWFDPRTIRSIQNLMVLNLILTFVIANISIFGHLGGLVAGILLFFIITPEHPYFIENRFNIEH